MHVEYRWSIVFVESGEVVSEETEILRLAAGHQGLCWKDSDNVWWYLMPEGVSCKEPDLQHMIERKYNTVRIYSGFQQRPMEQSSHGASRSVPRSCTARKE